MAWGGRCRRGSDQQRRGSGLRSVTLRSVEATLTMSFRPELRDEDESE